VLSHDQNLIGVVSLRQLLTSSKVMISDIMTSGPSLITVQEGQGGDEIAQIFSQWSFLAIPVVDAEGKMKGLLTLDDVVSVVQDAATEDIQKLGGQEALDAPYFQIGFVSMVKKRAGWLLVLFVGEMFTATAMGYYEKEIDRAVVLALFIPLIISSGGNSGSQASTLIIRAMALGEIRLKDWWRVLLRELSSGLSLGLILGSIGLLRIAFWPSRESTYGEHYYLIAMAVGCSLVGIVTWGTLAGSMLPFALRKCKLDPATASAPFVATLVDVTGLIIYFTIASFFLKGTLL
jgi:magnesium transporter